MALAVICLAGAASHYSDEPPPTARSPVTLIDVPESRGIGQKGDYYSIANQWARMHRERIELDRIRLEQDRLKAAQPAQAARTEVVYIEKPAAETRYVVLHKHKWRRHHGHHGKAHRHGKPTRFGMPQRQRPQTSRASLGYYKPLQ